MSGSKTIIYPELVDLQRRKDQGEASFRDITQIIIDVREGLYVRGLLASKRFEYVGQTISLAHERLGEIIIPGHKPRAEISEIREGLGNLLKPVREWEKEEAPRRSEAFFFSARYAATEVGLPEPGPTIAVGRDCGECERLRTKLIEVRFEQIQAKNRAEQADERADKLLDLANKLEAGNKDIQKALDARRTGKPCLHDKNEGYVARRLDEDLVAIEFETSDGRVVEQVHHRDQFVDGKLPREGDHMEAHVLAWFRPPEPADASKYLTPEELEHGFPGFQKAIERRRKQEQADRT